jgi:hypothetical protein
MIYEIRGFNSNDQQNLAIIGAIKINIQFTKEIGQKGSFIWI